PPDVGTARAAPAPAHRGTCSSTRGLLHRYCRDARSRPARCEWDAARPVILTVLPRPPRGTSQRAREASMHPLVNIAVRAARRAGEIIVRSLTHLESLQITTKGRNDYVSEVDRAAEREIIAFIHKHYPQHAILAEESGAAGDNETVWIIDPLDGTTNFLHGFPVFAVSIAVQQRGRLEAGVIYDPMRQEIFSAARGAGAHLDNRRLRV